MTVYLDLVMLLNFLVDLLLLRRIPLRHTKDALGSFATDFACKIISPIGELHLTKVKLHSPKVNFTFGKNFTSCVR